MKTVVILGDTILQREVVAAHPGCSEHVAWTKLGTVHAVDEIPETVVIRFAYLLIPFSLGIALAETARFALA